MHGVVPLRTLSWICTGVMIKIKMTTNFKSDLETFAPLFVHSVCQFDIEESLLC